MKHIYIKIWHMIILGSVCWSSLNSINKNNIHKNETILWKGNSLSKIKDIKHSIARSKKNAKATCTHALNLQDNINCAIESNLDDLESNFDSIQDKLCTVESSLDQMNISPEDFSILETILQNLCTTLDFENMNLSLNEMILIDACTIVDILESFNENKIESLEGSLHTILDKVCDIRSITDSLLDKEITILDVNTSILNKLCIEQSNITTFGNSLSIIEGDLQSTCDKEEQILSIGDILDSTFENVITSLEILNDNLSIHDDLICSKIEDLSILVSQKDSAICISLKEFESLVDIVRRILCEVPIVQLDIPLTITESGVYCLKEDLTSTDTAIIISADDVTLDLNRHTITGSGAISDGIVIDDSVSKTRIFEGVIQNFYNGIFASSSSDTVLLNSIAAINNVNAGFFLPLESAVLSECIANNNTRSGFNTEDGSKISFLNCTATCNGTFSNGTASDVGGFVAGNGITLNYSNCVAKENSDHGFLIGFDSVLSTSVVCFRNCESTHNALSGFVLTGTSIALENCDALNNGTMGSGNGFELTITSSFSCIRSCKAKTNTGDGFLTKGSQSVIISNEAEGNTGTGFDNTGVSNRFFSNIALNNGTNFSANILAVEAGTSSPTSSTGFWANLDL